MAAVRLHPRDKLTLISNLATMLSSGIPILEAITTLLDESKGAMREILLLLRKSLEQGHTVSDAMSKAPKTFDPVTINLVRAAEEAGTLEDSLHDLSETIKKDIAFTGRLRASMLYPMFVMVIFVGVLLMILLFVVPRISRVFAGLSVELPLPTQILMASSQFLISKYLPIIAVVVVVVVGLAMLYRLQKRALINAFLRLPLLSTLGRKIDLARFTRSMALLLKAGIPVAEALVLAKRVVVKKEVEAVVDGMIKSVESGKPMTDALRHHKHVIPPMMVRILQTAEMSGTLEKTMQELVEYFDEQVTHALKSMTDLIEPILIVVIGLMVGGMMLAIVAPIYGIVGQINTR